MDLESVADELYGLLPSEFTDVRNARAKEARADGDPELAEQIRSLRKPTTTAWLANLLVREHGDELRPLLELGAGLREAQASLQGDALRSLSRQRHQLVYALVDQAKASARAVGQRVSDATSRELEETLEAALADEEAADALQTGQLVTALEHVGFGGFGESTALATVTPLRPRQEARASKAAESKAANSKAAPPKSETRKPVAAKAKSGTTKTPTAAERRAAEAERRRAEEERRRAEAERRAQEERERRAEERRRAQEALDAAEQARDRADADLDQAHSAVEGAEARKDSAESDVRRLEQELDEATKRVTAADREARDAHRALDRADRAAREARRRAENARTALDRLPKA